MSKAAVLRKLAATPRTSKSAKELLEVQEESALNSIKEGVDRELQRVPNIPIKSQELSGGFQKRVSGVASFSRFFAFLLWEAAVPW